MRDPTHLRIRHAVLRRREDVEERDLLHVPPWDDYYEFPEAALEALATCVEADMPALIVGPPGCGKSSLVRNLAHALRQPVADMCFSGDVRTSHLFGKYIVAPSRRTGESVTVWRDGIVPTALRRSHWLLWDEFDACPAHIAIGLNRVLEPDRKLVLVDHDAEVVWPADPDCVRVFATANTLGAGDDVGIYAGTQPLNAATLDRFDVVIEIDYPAPDVEELILVNKAEIDRQTAGWIAAVAAMVRQSFASGETIAMLSTRRAVAWARMAQHMAPNADVVPAGVLGRALALAVTNKMAPDARDLVLGIARRVIGTI